LIKGCKVYTDNGILMANSKLKGLAVDVIVDSRGNCLLDSCGIDRDKAIKLLAESKITQSLKSQKKLHSTAI